jgi:hypothetical protein
MSSVPAFLKQIPADSRNFVPISSLLYAGGINALNTTTGVLTTATWAGNGRAGAEGGGSSRACSTLTGPGAGKLRDMGKTYVSASRVFRKVQLIVPNTQAASTFGVEGNSGLTPNSDYLTGYIELGWEGAGTPAPVARAP